MDQNLGILNIVDQNPGSHIFVDQNPGSHIFVDQNLGIHNIVDLLDPGQIFQSFFIKRQIIRFEIKTSLSTDRRDIK